MQERQVGTYRSRKHSRYRIKTIGTMRKSICRRTFLSSSTAQFCSGMNLSILTSEISSGLSSMLTSTYGKIEACGGSGGMTSTVDASVFVSEITRNVVRHSYREHRTSVSLYSSSLETHRQDLPRHDLWLVSWQRRWTLAKMCALRLISWKSREPNLFFSTW